MVAKKKKYKKLTKAEKERNKRVKEILIDDGIIPPVKKKLNRKKFVKETKEEFNNYIKNFNDMDYIIEGLSWMTSGVYKITPEQIGAVKVLKMSIEIKKYQEELKEKGEKSYNVDDMYKKVIKPILEL